MQALAPCNPLLALGINRNHGRSLLGSHDGDNGIRLDMEKSGSRASNKVEKLGSWFYW